MSLLLNAKQIQHASINIYEQFFNLSPDLLCITNNKYFIEAVNPKFVTLLGYEKKELEYKNIIELIHSNDKKYTTKKLKQLSKSNSYISFDNRCKHKEGHTIFLSWSATLDTKTQKINIVIKEKTEDTEKVTFKQIQNALELETIYAETNNKGIITKVNKKFCDISGYTEEELLGSTHKLVNSGYHTPTFFSNIWKKISSKKIWSGVIHNKNKNGNDYFVQSILIPISNNNHEIIRYVAIRQDITDKIKSQKNQLQTLNILNETSSVAKVGGWEMDTSTGALSWTDETFRILEVKKVDGLTPNLPEGIDLFIEQDKPIIEQAVERAAKFGTPYSLELRAKTATGKTKWVYTNGKANYENGRIKTISGTIQDINERKLTEIKLNKEKQKSIANAKFAALGELSASIAHEINNPLGIISGYAELLKSTKGNIASQALSEKLSIIIKSCERISHIVKSLKKFSRTDNNKKHTVHSLDKLINETITLSKPKLTQKNIELTYTPIINNEIICNEIEIEQVILNLINNSVDAISLLKEKWINITLINIQEYIRITITDSGEGIPLDKHKRIFEPFYTTKEINKGTGLGLSIIKNILDNHNAKIYIDRTNMNTCFIIDFPKINNEIRIK